MMQGLVIGLGNPDRGDDGVGRVVAQNFRRVAPAGIAVREHDGEASGLIALLPAELPVVIIDAARAGGTAGRIHRFDAGAGPLPAELGAWSSHGLGLAQAIELARVLGRLPRCCIVFAVEGASFALAAGLSPAVAAAAQALPAQILAELAALAAPGAPERGNGP